MTRLPRDMTGRRILGLTFDGRPIVEPKNAGSSLTFAAAGGGKTTSVSVPALVSMLPDRKRAVFVNDVKGNQIAERVAMTLASVRRQTVVLDPFGVDGGDDE